jgi:hypothetical protein
VTPDLPLRKRTALIQIFVEDGGWETARTLYGHAVEELGRALGPRLAANDYAVEWVLAGPQATYQNVRFALNELAGRGYVIDVFSAVHGYPIELADQLWENVTRVTGLGSVRLFYTTACDGGLGADEFLTAGVRTYIAAPGTNFVNAFHMVLFYRIWASTTGASALDASAEAFRKLFALRALDVPVLRRLAGLVGLTDAAREATRPIVFGDRSMTAATDTQRSLQGTKGAIEGAR